MIALRFTTNKNEQGFQSEDQVNKVKFAGVCAYDITEEVEQLQNDGSSFSDALEICAKKQAEFDNWHAHNTNGEYVIFDADFVDYERDNQDHKGNRAIIATINNYIAFGKLQQLNYGYRCENIELF